MSEVGVDVDAGEVTVLYDGARLDARDLRARLEAAGWPVLEERPR